MVKLTEDLQKKLLHFLELGVPIKYACEALGIDERSYYVWKKLGKRDKDRPDSKYFQFLQQVESIPGKAMARKLLHLEQAAANGSVSANIWFLEHRFPEVFKQSSDLNVTLKPSSETFRLFLEGPYRQIKAQREKTLIPTTYPNTNFKPSNINTGVHLLPPPAKDPVTEEPDDLIRINPDEEENEEENDG
jgi:hypothetical protein